MPRTRTVRTAILTDDLGRRYHMRAEVPPGCGYPEGWMITWDSTRQIRRKIRSVATLHVLDALPDYLSWTEWRRLPQQQLAASLDLGQASISRALTELLGLQLIERRGNGPVTEWRLSLSAGWRGGAPAYHAARRTRGMEQLDDPPPPPAAAVAEGRLCKAGVAGVLAVALCPGHRLAMQRPRLLLAAFMLLVSSAAVAQPWPVFRIHDHLDPHEVEETTSVYIDGELVQIFRLSAQHSDGVVELPARPGEVEYLLCGSITVRQPDGSAEIHRVDGSGVLTDVAGRDFDAVAAFDFTLFYFVDVTPNRPPAPVRVRRVRSCAEALS